MAQDAPPDPQGASTRPYLIRALHEWCTDHGFTPYLAVFVDDRVQVPVEYVKNNEIVLNVGFDATQGLKLGNELIEFRARFGGVARDIVVPVDHVVAIYSRENGQGMAFPTPTTPPAVVGPALHTVGHRAASSKPSMAAPTLRLAPSASGPALVAPSAVPASAAPNSASAKGLHATPLPGALGNTPATGEVPSSSTDPDHSPTPPTPAPQGGRPSLKRIK
jgi:stringent starvation protein B